MCPQKQLVSLLYGLLFQSIKSIQPLEQSYLWLKLHVDVLWKNSYQLFYWSPVNEIIWKKSVLRIHRLRLKLCNLYKQQPHRWEIENSLKSLLRIKVFLLRNQNKKHNLRGHCMPFIFMTFYTCCYIVAIQLKCSVMIVSRNKNAHMTNAVSIFLDWWHYLMTDSWTN